MDPRARTASSVAGNRVYVEVQPQYKWVPGDKEDSLIVDLTAFKNETEFRKEHLRIQIDNYGNLKVSGERPLSGQGNRWNRFQRILHLVEDCDASGIRATFDDGVLTVVMPKLVRGQQPPPPPPVPAPPPQPAAAPEVTAARRPPAEAQAPPTSPPARAPAQVPPTSAPGRVPSRAPARQPSKSPAAPPPPPPPPPPLPPKRTEDRSGGEKTVPEDGKEQFSAPADDSQKTAAGDKKAAEPAADAAGTTPLLPVPEEKVTPAVRKLSLPPEAVEEEKPRRETAGGVDLGALRTRPRQLLVNVLVAVMVLVGLGFYLIYRYRGAQAQGGQEKLPALSIREE